MKFDAENLLKNAFWLLLGGFVLFWIAAIVFFKFGPAEAFAKGGDALKKTREESDAAAKKTPRNYDTYTKPWEERAKEFKGIKEKVWAEAWALQNPEDAKVKGANRGKDLATWPRSSNDKIKEELNYPGAQTSDRDIADYLRQYRDKLYIGQFLAKDSDGRVVKDPRDMFKDKDAYLDVLIAPIEFKGLRDGFETIMAPTTGSAMSGVGADRAPIGGGERFRGGPGPGPGRPAGPAGPNGPNGQGGGSITSLWEGRRLPTFEEVFLAQEDFWIKRDLLDVIREARDSAARMPAEMILPELLQSFVAPGGFYRTGDKIEATFRNSTWELKLVLIPKEIKGKTQYVIGLDSSLKNVSAAKRVLDLKKGAQFRLRQGDQTDEFKFEGTLLSWNQEPLRLGEERKEGPIQLSNVKLDEPFEVEQIFDWDSSPIKQVVDLKVGFQSHRTAGTALKPGLSFAKKDEPGKDPSAAPSPGAKSGPPAPAGPPAPPAGPAGPGGPDSAPTGPTAPTDVTDRNNLQRNRYLHVTPECRHVPVALVLVVDQAHIHEVLAAVANSRLRVQTTQVQFQQASGVVSQLVEPDEGDKSGDPKKGGPGPGPGDLRDPRRRGPMGPMGDPRNTGGLTTTGSQEDPNLVEVTVYGIASLYERFPPRKEDKPADAPADPAAQTPPPPPTK
jgi:hypothetical protein